MTVFNTEPRGCNGVTRIIPVGLASYGLSGRVFHAPLLATHSGFRLAAVVERQADAARARYPHVRRHRSVDEMLADDDLELVIVNTPDATHSELTRRSLEAGKHVVVEKPFTGQVDRARDLVELAAQRGRILTVFQNRRWDGDFLTVQQVIASGVLGRIVECEARWDRFRPIVNTASWKEQAEAGSGVLTNLGSHLIDQALMLFGWPNAITADLDIVRDGALVDDWMDLRLHYERLRVTLRCSTVAQQSAPRYVIHGTTGSFVKHGLDPQEAALAEGTSPDDPAWGADTPARYGTLTRTDHDASTQQVPTIPGRYQTFYDGVYAAVTDHASPPVTTAQAMRNVRLLEAARRSAATRSTISLEGNA